MERLLFISVLFITTNMPGLLMYEKQCEYLMGTQIISCENSIRTIKDVTDLIDQNTNVIIIKGAAHLKITDACHKPQGCRHINTYQISRVDDLDIDSEAFSGLSNLLHLKMNDNGLYKLENRVFHGLEKLQRLDLTNCNISKIDDKAFVGLKNLEILDLANNDIETVTPRLFKDLASLTSLGLYNNKIEKLELNTFANLVTLRDLDLSNNKLTRIDARVFNRIPNLTYLYLSFNQIEIVTWNFECPNLKFLYFKQNKLKEIKEKLFASSQNLLDVDLSLNDVEKIHPRAFFNLHSLMNLNLKGNTAIDKEQLIFGRQKPLVTI